MDKEILLNIKRKLQNVNKWDHLKYFHDRSGEDMLRSIFEDNVNINSTPFDPSFDFCPGLCFQLLKMNAKLKGIVDKEV